MVATPIEIIVKDSCDCPICGAPEVANKNAPVKEWRFNVRAFKVIDAQGRAWSECLICRETDGNGWFSLDEEENVTVEPSRIPALEARGKTVEKVS